MGKHLTPPPPVFSRSQQDVGGSRPSTYEIWLEGGL